jgi:hypothetical protein
MPKRSIVIERWLALYRAAEHGVQIVRILDGGRDLSAIEWTPSEGRGSRAMPAGRDGLIFYPTCR